MLKVRYWLLDREESRLADARYSPHLRPRRATPTRSLHLHSRGLPTLRLRDNPSRPSRHHPPLHRHRPDPLPVPKRLPARRSHSQTRSYPLSECRRLLKHRAHQPHRLLTNCSIPYSAWLPSLPDLPRRRKRQRWPRRRYRPHRKPSGHLLLRHSSTSLPSQHMHLRPGYTSHLPTSTVSSRHRDPLLSPISLYTGTRYSIIVKPSQTVSPLLCRSTSRLAQRGQKADWPSSWICWT